MLAKEITTPVLFLVFNRPEKTQRVFDVIRQAKPSKLYIAADAPRENVLTDQQNCDRVKEIVSSIDWKCEVKYLFHTKNLGCSLAGKKAWDWIFTQEEEMIFIEDDGLVSLSFFSYCQELLEKYRFDNRIAYIGGVNYGLRYGNSSYYFSHMPVATYSMATWKRVYSLYEFKLESYASLRNSRSFRQSFFNTFIYHYYRDKFDKFVKLGGNTYDLQMIYLIHKYNLNSIFPNINLTSNIGLDFGGANNNIDPSSKIALKYGNRPRFELTEIIHPKKMEINRTFERKQIKNRILYDRSWFLSILSFYLSPYYSPVYQKLKYHFSKFIK